MGPSASLPLRTILFALAALLAAACGPAGSPAGSPCTLATQCASQLCLSGASGGVCVSRCTSSTDCTATGAVCGRFDYRGLDPDSGMFTGPQDDVIHVCRPRLNPVCSASVSCGHAGQTCVGDPGVCTTPCALDGDCSSNLCIPSSTGTCGSPGSCAPLCDDLLECPHSWYCNMANVDTVGHGRCEPIQPMPGGNPDDATCMDATN